MDLLETFEPNEWFLEYAMNARKTTRQIFNIRNSKNHLRIHIFKIGPKYAQQFYVFFPICMSRYTNFNKTKTNINIKSFVQQWVVKSFEEEGKKEQHFNAIYHIKVAPKLSPRKTQINATNVRRPCKAPFRFVRIILHSHI